jgi:hypothetical protein
MSIDLSDSYKSAEDKIRASKTYVAVKKDAAKLKKEIKDNLEQDKDKVTSTVEKLKDQQKRFQRQVKTQLDQLLSLAQSNSGSGSATLNYIKTAFIKAAIKIEPKIYNILLKETIHALGCSHQQSYQPNQAIYIKVKSTDLLKLLKRSPNESNAAPAYEKIAPAPKQLPYSMNWSLWDRLQNLNVPIDYYGASGQKLFEISYVQFDGNGVSGDFFKVVLSARVNGVNNIVDFLVDYYKSINVVDLSNIFLQLMDMITGAISFDANIGVGELDEKNKFALLLQRILGLCFDSKKEIDVTGTAKVAELDGVDETFFEFTDIDLRHIDSMTSNMSRGVVEFEECQSVLLPVNSQAIIDELSKINKVTNDNEAQKILENLTNVLTDNERWKILVPNSVDIKLTVDLSFLTNLPKAIVFALLSPKIILPLLIMAKSINQIFVDAVETIMTFMKTFKKFVINLMSNIGGLFIEELFNIIKKDIRKLIQSIAEDISKEAALKKYKIILLLVELTLIVAQFIRNWRQCKSVIDEILALLSLAGRQIKNSIPSPLLVASELLAGFSKTRAFINVIEEMQKLGLPTGAMPDGSPNLMLQSMLGQISGTESENANRKTQIFIKPLTVTPAFLTLPTGKIFGMSY